MRGVILTAVAVFGGAVGVGLALGLQSIASNFISGIIILLDRSVTAGDFVELDDGQKGFVREFKMRYTVLETYDGKDILVPNEKFVSSAIDSYVTGDDERRSVTIVLSELLISKLPAFVEALKLLLQFCESSKDFFILFAEVTFNVISLLDSSK